MPSRPLRLTLSALSLFLAVSAGAQQLLKPQSVRFEGIQEFSADELLAIAGVQKGQTYTSDFLNQSAQKLMNTGAFEKVGFKFDGVDLTYLIRENPDLYPVTLENLPIEAGPELDKRLHTQLPLYHGKVPSEGTLLDDVQSALQKIIADQGLDAKVAFVPAGDNPNKKATSIKFRIESPAVEVGDLRLTGVSDSVTPTLTRALTLVPHPYDTVHSRKGIEDQIARIYRDLGFPAAIIDVHPLGKPVLANGVIRVPFAITVAEGRPYKLGTVQIAPDVPVTAADIGKLALARDHYKDSQYLTAIVAAVDSRLKARGYLDCVVTPHASLDDSAGVANYTVTATPGPQYHLGLFKFENVSDSLRSLLMKSWQMMPGDPFDESYVSNFVLLAQKDDPALQHSLSGVKATYDVHADPQTHEVNLIIRLSR